MGKQFNTAGRCHPERHYMVNMERQLAQLEQMVEQGDYFCVNRGRQYGKTTMLSLLKGRLEDCYIVFSVSFEGIGETPFMSAEALAYTLLELFRDNIEYGETKQVPEAARQLISEAISSCAGEKLSVLKLSRLVSRLCAASEKAVVLLIDEVDRAANYSAFMELLGMFRDKYLKRPERPTFQSVILASVYDIKNLKLKMRPQEAHQYNSPWNIAADFDVSMEFTRADIAGMLEVYQRDYCVGMDIPAMAQMLYDYTSGYPFLVSRLCKLLDEKVAGTEKFPDRSAAWSGEGFQEALRLLLTESNTLFDDLRKKLSDYPNLRRMLYELLYEGQSFPYNTDDEILDIASMFGYIKECEGKVMVSNRIFETRLYNLFVSEERIHSAIYTEGSRDKAQFIRNGRLDMKRILERFCVHFTELYGANEESFLEKSGRKFFLFYLKPIINGTGNYYVEARTRDEGRTDVIVDYLGEQYVVELKIWRGNAYHERGERQLLEYLEAYRLERGYLLSFDFNKKKEVGVKEIQLGERVLVEAVV